MGYTGTLDNIIHNADNQNRSFLKFDDYCMICSVEILQLNFARVADFPLLIYFYAGFR